MSEALEQPNYGQIIDDGLIDGATNLQQELGPFWLDPDEMMAKLPAVAENIALRRDTIAKLAQEGGSNGRGALGDAYLDMCWVGAQLLLVPNGEEQLNSTARELFSVYDATLAEAAAVELLSKSRHIAGLIEGARGSATELAGQVRDTIIGDKNAEFELITFIADVYKVNHDLGSGMTADLLMYGDGKLLSGMRDALKAGYYDDVLYGRVLKFIRQTNERELTNGLAKIAEIVTLTSSILGSYVDTQREPVDETKGSIDSGTVDNVMLRIIESLPIQYRSHFASYKEGFIKAFEATLLRSAENNKALLGGPDMAKAFRLVGSQYIEKVRVHNMTKNTAGGRGITAIQDRRQKFNAVQSRRRTRISAQTEVNESAPTAESDVKKWNIIRLDNQGKGLISRVLEEDPIGELKQEYFRRYQKTQALDDFLTTILERIEHLDLSQGFIPGLKKYSDTTLSLDGKNPPCFEYKPMEGFGNSSSAKRAKKIRVLLSQIDQDTMGIITIIDRDDVYEYCRNAGLRGVMGRRGNK